jgi:chemotaxis protein MotB
MASSSEEEEGPSGAPEWIVTFTDMISLLVTFFVLMMTFSSMNDFDRLKLDALLQSGPNVTDAPAADRLIPPPAEDQIADIDLRRGALQPHSRPAEELDETIDEMGQKLSESHVPVDLGAASDGVVIQFGPDCVFAPGSATLSPRLERNLCEIGRVLEHYRFTVVVEGFTDDDFAPTPSHPTARALGFARADAAAQALLAGSGLSPMLVQVAGVGEERPRFDNEVVEGRRRNRRVEIRVRALSKVRAAAVSTERRIERTGVGR